MYNIPLFTHSHKLFEEKNPQKIENAFQTMFFHTTVEYGNKKNCFV